MAEKVAESVAEEAKVEEEPAEDVKAKEEDQGGLLGSVMKMVRLEPCQFLPCLPRMPLITFPPPPSHPARRPFRQP